MPLSQADLVAIGKVVDQKVDERMRRTKVEHHDFAAELVRKQSESQHSIDTNNMAFERYMRDAMAVVVKSIPPAATAAAGAEAAAIAGAKAAIESSGGVKATMVAADRADQQSRAAKMRASITIWVSVAQGIAIGLWEAYKFITAHSGH